MGYSGKNTSRGGLKVKDTKFSRVLMKKASVNCRGVNWKR